MLVVVTGGPPVQADAPRRSLAFSTLAAAAREHDLPAVFVTPAACVRLGRALSGEAYDLRSASFVATKTTLPAKRSVVFDALYLSDLPRFRRALRTMRRSLRRQSIPYFNPAMPAKDVLYRRLAQAALGPGSIPWTAYEATPKRVLTLLDDHDCLWLKPVFGSGGRDIAVIRRRAKACFEVIAQRPDGHCVERTLNPEELTLFLSRANQVRRMVVQEQVDLLQTHDGRRVDFRVTLVRGRAGAWRVVGITQRKAAPGSILTNYHAGGEVLSLTETDTGTRLLQAEFDMPEDALVQITRAALAVSEELTRMHPTFGLLGVDVGCTPDGRYYVYDCNARPGRDILTDDELVEMMKSIAGFARYLADRYNSQ